MNTLPCKCGCAERVKVDNRWSCAACGTWLRRAPKPAPLAHLKDTKLLAQKAVQWLRSQGRCVVVGVELRPPDWLPHREQPDVLGWTCEGHPILLEVKISRGDFLADLNKPWRQQHERAIGRQRLYVAPEGLLDKDELPERWGLLELRGKNERRSMLHVTKWPGLFDTIYRTRDAESAHLVACCRRLGVPDNNGVVVAAYRYDRDREEVRAGSRTTL